MSFRFVHLLLVVICLLAFPSSSPAPLVYRPGEGWVYEPVGGEAKWQRPRAKEQLEVAQALFDRKAYSLALRAARRVMQLWPTSDYGPQAQYLVARCYEADGELEKAFKEYQKLLEKQPKYENLAEVRQRQFQIANQYLAGKWFKFGGYLPYRSMTRTARMYAQIVKTGPYSDVAPQAQLSIGTAQEKQTIFFFKHPDYPEAIKAYDLAADRYFDQPEVAAEAIFRAGLAYKEEAQSADRDRTTAGQAIAKFTDFMALYPDEPRVPDAQKLIASLRGEQARGNFAIAQFYEKRKKWDGARIYYNEVLLQDPNSPYANSARQRIDQLKQRPQEGAAQ
ncbi:MAG TPA: outer membrane protein assembly factor BamD [Candidatus Paceibacterota bacterium]|nr:outer membrane protein assembly factor BamD [Verrucomicrobiota bacterium]HSA10542.1 outer membrane protein assembly factor BamD [Candidatus Paceibacterota bacterium]